MRYECIDDLDDLIRISCKNLGIKNILWQTWDEKFVYSWDKYIPSGFLEHYYGVDADFECALSRAVKGLWPSFTFRQARTAFGQLRSADSSKKVWDSFGLRDGIVMLDGTKDRISACAFFLNDANRFFQSNYRHDLRQITSRLDGLLADRTAILSPTPRKPMQLSSEESGALEMQIAHPDWLFAKQAQTLGISEQQLQHLHARVARKFSVTSFSSAVAEHLRK